MSIHLNFKENFVKTNFLYTMATSLLIILAFQNCKPMTPKPEHVTETNLASIIGTSTVNIMTSAVRKAIFFPGKNAGEKILAAQADLINSGFTSGTIDASDFWGVQYITDPLNIGSVWNNSFTLRLGRATYVTSAPIRIGRNSALIGEPTGNWTWSTSGGSPYATVIRAADDANLWPAVVMIGGSAPGDGVAAVVQDIIIDGNRAKHGTAAWGNGIFIDRASGVQITRTSVIYCSGHGISVNSSLNSAGVSNGDSGGTTIGQSWSAYNGACGLALANTGDTFVIQTQFENNNADGVCANNSPALRITNSDFGGNLNSGLSAVNESNALIVNGNQFGNNVKNDLSITGGWGGHVITGNSFIGSSHRSAPDQFSAIVISNTSENSITGNFINTDADQNRLHSGIRLVGGAHVVAGNSIRGKRGPGGAIRLESNAILSTSNLDSTTD